MTPPHATSIEPHPADVSAGKSAPRCRWTCTCTRSGPWAHNRNNALVGAGRHLWSLGRTTREMGRMAEEHW